MKRYIITIIFCLSLSSASWAALANYYDQHAIGWHWYHEINPEEKEKAASSDPIQQMNAIHIKVQQALDKAILNPTSANVSRYITLQNQVSALSSKFAQVWQRVLLEEPRLNYTLKHPTNSLGRQIYLDESNRKSEAVIQQFAKRYGLFFFYRGSCPYCHQFAPIVKRLSDAYQISIIPISLDGGLLPEFPNAQLNSGQAETLRINTVPALFAVEPHTHKIIPVAYGLMSETDLRERILNIATDFKGVDDD